MNLKEKLLKRIRNEIRGFIDAIKFLFNILFWKELWMMLLWASTFIAYCFVLLYLFWILPTPLRAIIIFVLIVTPAVVGAIIWHFFKRR